MIYGIFEVELELVCIFRIGIDIMPLSGQNRRNIRF